MREYKFRGKPIEKSIYESSDGFVYGYLVGDTIVGDIMVADEDEFIPKFWVPVKVDTIGQYTGLKDKNGVEIYEGDIVLHNYFKVGSIETKYKLVHTDYRFQFVGIDNNDQFDIYGFRMFDEEKNKRIEYENDCIHNVEVVGNLHEEDKQ